jgi:hypothetical protein
MSGEREKRSAPDSASEEPEQKRPASEPSSTGSCSWGTGAAACSWGSKGTGCSWGGGAGSTCSWGTGGSSFGGGFAAVASSGTGFGSLAAPEAPPSATTSAGGFASFGGTAQTFSASVSPPAARAGDKKSDSPTPADEASTPVEAAACTGEEDETCVHRVRAKLFRLEVGAISANPVLHDRCAL